MNPEEYHFYTATQKYGKGQLICRLGNTPCDSADPKRIQIDENNFILPPHIFFHSCEPNSAIDWQDMTVRALRIIKPKEKITLHYGTSEDDFSIGAFTCHCGSELCVGQFRGFKYMSAETRTKLKPYLSPYLLHKYFPQDL